MRDAITITPAEVEELRIAGVAQPVLDEICMRVGCTPGDMGPGPAGPGAVAGHREHGRDVDAADHPVERADEDEQGDMDGSDGSDYEDEGDRKGKKARID